MAGSAVGHDAGPDSGRVVALAPVGHVPALDGVRGLAILSVMLAHWAPSDTFSRAQDFVWSVPNRIGVLGVDLFFVLSGFLITGILLDTKGSPGWVGKFYMRRILRIFPLYFGFLALMFFGLMPMLASLAPEQAQSMKDHAAWYWTYTFNIALATKPGYKGSFYTLHLWSLSVEEQFYVVWPWVVLAASRNGLLRACGGLLVLGVALRFAVALGHVPGVVSWYAFTPTHLDGILMGSALAAWVRGPDGWAVIGDPDRLARPLFYGLAGVVALRLLPAPFRATLLFPSYDALVFATVVAYGVGASRGRASVLRSRVTRALGRYAYGLYVVHYPLLFWVQFWGTPQTIPGQVVRVGLGFVLSLLIAIPLWHFFERPILSLKRFVEYA